MVEFFIKRLGVFDPDVARILSAALDRQLDDAAPYVVVTVARASLLGDVPESLRPAAEEVVGPIFAVARVPATGMARSALESWCAAVETRYGCCLGIRADGVFVPWQALPDGLTELRFAAVGAQAPPAIEDLVQQCALRAVMA